MPERGLRRRKRVWRDSGSLVKRYYCHCYHHHEVSEPSWALLILRDVIEWPQQACPGFTLLQPLTFCWTVNLALEYLLIPEDTFLWPVGCARVHTVYCGKGVAAGDQREMSQQDDRVGLGLGVIRAYFSF